MMIICNTGCFRIVVGFRRGSVIQLGLQKAEYGDKVRLLIQHELVISSSID